MYTDGAMLPPLDVVQDEKHSTGTNGLGPEADSNVAKVDTIAHAQTSVVHKQPPQGSERFTTMCIQKVLRHELTPRLQERQ